MTSFKVLGLSWLAVLVVLRDGSPLVNASSSRFKQPPPRNDPHRSNGSMNQSNYTLLTGFASGGSGEHRQFNAQENGAHSYSGYESSQQRQNQQSQQSQQSQQHSELARQRRAEKQRQLQNSIRMQMQNMEANGVPYPFAGGHSSYAHGFSPAEEFSFVPHPSNCSCPSCMVALHGQPNETRNFSPVKPNFQEQQAVADPKLPYLGFYPYSQIEEELIQGKITVTYEYLFNAAFLIVQLGPHFRDIPMLGPDDVRGEEWHRFNAKYPHLRPILQNMVDLKQFYYISPEQKFLDAPASHFWTLIGYYFKYLCSLYRIDVAKQQLEMALNNSVIQEAMIFAAPSVQPANFPTVCVKHSSQTDNSEQESMSVSKQYYCEWARVYHSTSIVMFLAENCPEIIYGNIKLFTSFKHFFFVNENILNPQGPYRRLLFTVSLAYLDQFMPTCPDKTLVNLIRWRPSLAAHITPGKTQQIYRYFDPAPDAMGSTCNEANLTAFVENYPWLVLDPRFITEVPDFVNKAINFGYFIDYLMLPNVSWDKFLHSMIAYVYFTEKMMAAEVILLLNCWKRFCQLEEKQQGWGKHTILEAFFPILGRDAITNLRKEGHVAKNRVNLASYNEDQRREYRASLKKLDADERLFTVYEPDIEFAMIVGPIIWRLRALRFQRFHVLVYLTKHADPQLLFPAAGPEANTLLRALVKLASTFFHPVLRKMYAYRGDTPFYQPSLCGDVLPLPRISPSQDIMMHNGLWSALWRNIFHNNVHNLDVTPSTNRVEELKELWAMPYAELPGDVAELTTYWMVLAQYLDHLPADLQLITDLNIAAFNLILGPAHSGMDVGTVMARFCIKEHVESFVKDLPASEDGRKAAVERAVYFVTEEAKSLAASLEDCGFDRYVFTTLETRGRDWHHTSWPFSPLSNEGTIEFLEEACADYVQVPTTAPYDLSRVTNRIRWAFILMGQDITSEDWLKIANSPMIARALALDPFLLPYALLEGLVSLVSAQGPESERLGRDEMLASFIIARLILPCEILKYAESKIDAVRRRLQSVEKRGNDMINKANPDFVEQARVRAQENYSVTCAKEGYNPDEPLESLVVRQEDVALVLRSILAKSTTSALPNRPFLEGHIRPACLSKISYISSMHMCSHQMVRIFEQNELPRPSPVVEHVKVPAYAPKIVENLPPMPKPADEKDGEIFVFRISRLRSAESLVGVLSAKHGCMFVADKEHNVFFAVLEKDPVTGEVTRRCVSKFGTVYRYGTREDYMKEKVYLDEEAEAWRLNAQLQIANEPLEAIVEEALNRDPTAFQTEETVVPEVTADQEFEGHGPLPQSISLHKDSRIRSPSEVSSNSSNLSVRSSPTFPQKISPSTGTSTATSSAQTDTTNLGSFEECSNSLDDGETVKLETVRG